MWSSLDLGDIHTPDVIKSCLVIKRLLSGYQADAWWPPLKNLILRSLLNAIFGTQKFPNSPSIDQKRINCKVFAQLNEMKRTNISVGKIFSQLSIYLKHSSSRSEISTNHGTPLLYDYSLRLECFKIPFENFDILGLNTFE